MDRSRMFVATGHGTSMVFRVSPKNRVYWASPKMPSARGWQLSRLRGYFKARHVTFYEVTQGDVT
jgi:hypothetical protein